MLDPYAPLVATLSLPDGAHLEARAGKAALRPQNAPALLGSLAHLQARQMSWPVLTHSFLPAHMPDQVRSFT